MQFDKRPTVSGPDRNTLHIVDGTSDAYSEVVLAKSISLSTIEFCGKRIDVPEIELCMKADNWESTVMLAEIGPHNTSRSLAADAGFRKILRNDTEAEFDANNLCDYLEARATAGTLALSPEFRAFEKLWRRDEMNHALGFAMIESFLYGVSVEQIFQELREQRPRFSPLEERGFFADEFTTAVVIAYDEIATTRSYSEDKKDRYPQFENPALVDWIGNVAADESRHFHNIISVIKHNHANRIQEIPGLVRKILDWEQSPHEYERTFVLDHTGVQFTNTFVADATRILLKQFGFSLEDLPDASKTA
jgi:hypothetical protein